jgi:hypothetical protein
MITNSNAQKNSTMRLQSAPTSDPRRWINIPVLLLIALWSVSVVGELLSRFLRLTMIPIVAGLVSFAFIIVLIWVLARAKPQADDFPAITGAGKPRLSFGVRTVLILSAALATFVVGLMIGTGAAPLLVTGLFGLGLTLAWRRELDRRLLATGMAVSLLSGLGIALLGNGDPTWAIFNGLCLPPSFIGGILLLRRTGFGRVHWMDSGFIPGLRSFLWGCLLALPAALLNLLGNLQGGDTWVRHVWQPIYAFVPALAEETWARLFLTTLCYAVLRPVSGRHPRWAVGVAVLIGALVHGFAHTGIDPFGLVIGSLLYGLPTALLFIKKDFEHAVGYHFLIDFVRFLAALLNG